MMLIADDLGPIQWTVEPPDFLWIPEAPVAPIPGPHTPEIGRAYYNGWKGPTPPVEQSLKDLKTALDWQSISRHFEMCCKFYALKERVWAAQNGHTAVRLSKLLEANLWQGEPPRRAPVIQTQPFDALHEQFLDLVQDCEPDVTLPEQGLPNPSGELEGVYPKCS